MIVMYAITQKGTMVLGINSAVMTHTEKTLAKEFQNSELEILFDAFNNHFIF